MTISPNKVVRRGSPFLSGAMLVLVVNFILDRDEIRLDLQELFLPKVVLSCLVLQKLFYL